MEQITDYKVSSSPHIKGIATTAKIMWTVIICLLPAGIWGIYNFGLRSLAVICFAVLAAVGTEGVFNLLLKKKCTLADGSAVLTGLLVGYNMPPGIPLLIPAIASVFAIAVVKQTFGGLGRNWMNPALAGRVFVMFCFTGEMTSWSAPRGAADAFSGATPLNQGTAAFLSKGTYLDLLVGNISGCIGEVSALLLLAGAVFLFITRIITWEIPLSYLGSFTLLTWIFGGGDGLFSGDVLFHLLSGGLILGAFYMATDMVTSPLTTRGMLIFGVGCGFFTFLIRFFGGFPEGVSLAIIIMNMVVPLIDKYTKPVKFGMVKEVKNEK